MPVKSGLRSAAACWSMAAARRSASVYGRSVVTVWCGPLGRARAGGGCRARRRAGRRGPGGGGRARGRGTRRRRRRREGRRRARRRHPRTAGAARSQGALLIVGEGLLVLRGERGLCAHLV